jgi:hypothetical protein
MKDKKRMRRGAMMCSPDDSLECVMAVMMHSDLCNSCDDEDRSDESEGGKRRRSSALSSLASKTSDSSPRGSLAGSESSIFVFKEPNPITAYDTHFVFGANSGLSCLSETKSIFTFESFGDSISRNLGDMKQIAPCTLDLPIFESLSATECPDALVDSCSLTGFFPMRR